MSLKNKITLSFLISAFIIAILAAFEYVSFIQIRKEIGRLELADTIKSRSLLLRRHEKNFFLYGTPKAAEESKAVHKYLKELYTVIDANLATDKTGKLAHLKGRIDEYGDRFTKIETSVKSLACEIEKTGRSNGKYHKFFPLIELTFWERPYQTADFLENTFLLSPKGKLVSGLRGLHSDMQILRKDGEDIVSISEDLDKIARRNAENFIYRSQMAILIFFPLFFISGIGALFFISKSVGSRLRLLIDVVERTGKGHFSRILMPSQKDEVGLLIGKFNDMEEQLAQREKELGKKNEELLQSRKLAAMGTLASGVAHELNNPLNNIYISAQVLMKETGDSYSLTARETVNDILGQTLRVKRIVGDLLEFARGKEPQLREVEIDKLLMGAYKLVSTTTDTKDINFVMDTDPAGVIINADYEQMERVFINLFTNAVDAMNGKGDLAVAINREPGFITIKISDTGKGMPADIVDKIFEPFYTTKDKGTGLGLAIVFNIIKKHNGAISVESEKERGTRFTITLPARGTG
ncbi:MAG: ATP-binding protein [Thermodesulfobacteriota bacterium]